MTDSIPEWEERQIDVWLDADPIDDLPFDPRDSISLQRPGGCRSYQRTRLKNAAYELHRHLQEELAGSVGQEVLVREQSIGQVPDLTKPISATRDGPALQTLLHSLAHVASSPRLTTGPRQSCVAVPFDPAAYRQGGDHARLNASSVRKYVLALVHIGWLNFVRAYYNHDTGSGMRSRVASTDLLLDWMVGRGLVFQHHPRGLTSEKRLPEDQLLRVSYGDRNERGRKPQRQLHRPLDENEEILPALNDALATQKVSCPLTSYAQYKRAYDFDAGKPRFYLGGRTDVYRIFSEEDGCGGRLYGHWVQRLPKDFREQLQINRRPAAELDYSGMQLALLYVTQGHSVPEGDLYKISGFSRDDMKAVLTRSVGTPTREEALAAIRKRLRDENRSREGRAEQMYDAFWVVHPEACPHRISNRAVWSRLQTEDSQLALGVIRSLLEQGVTPIPIHDSFVVEAQHADTTKQVMEQEFSKMFPETSITVERVF